MLYDAYTHQENGFTYRELLLTDTEETSRGIRVFVTVYRHSSMEAVFFRVSVKAGGSVRGRTGVLAAGSHGSDEHGKQLRVFRRQKGDESNIDRLGWLG